MKTAILLLPLLLLANAQAKQTALPVHVGGRVVQEGEAWRFGWPGVYFEGRFRGTAVTVRAEAKDEPLRVLIDGKPAGMIAPGATELNLTGLSRAEHAVRLEKVTESQSGSARFLGFFTSGESLPATSRRGQIEFIGDSHTVGYGNTRNAPRCTEQEVHDSTDTQRAFGPLLAHQMGDADYRILAFSGRGVVRNYAGIAPGESLPSLYPRAIAGEQGVYRGDAHWKPRVIVINLGTNDFSTPLHAGEAWPDDVALRADYRARYIAFVRARQAEQPQALIVLMAPSSFQADVAAVASATGATLVRLGKLEMTGCNGHPSLADHQAMAMQVWRALTIID
jgi:lysophospholipase L1-like esterase